MAIRVNLTPKVGLDVPIPLVPFLKTEGTFLAAENLKLIRDGMESQRYAGFSGDITYRGALK